MAAPHSGRGGEVYLDLHDAELVEGTVYREDEEIEREQLTSPIVETPRLTLTKIGKPSLESAAADSGGSVSVSALAMSGTMDVSEDETERVDSRRADLSRMSQQFEKDPSQFSAVAQTEMLRQMEDRRRVEEDSRVAEALQFEEDTHEVTDSRVRISASVVMVGTRPGLTPPSSSASPTRDLRVRRGGTEKHTSSDSESELTSALPSSASTVRATASATLPRRTRHVSSVVASSSAEPSQRRPATVSASTGTRAATALRTCHLPLRVRSFQLAEVMVRQLTDWLPPEYRIYRVIDTTLGSVTVFYCAGRVPVAAKKATATTDRRSPDNIINEISVMYAMREDDVKRKQVRFGRFFAHVMFCGQMGSDPTMVYFGMPYFHTDLMGYIVSEIKRKKYDGRRPATAEHRRICRQLFKGLNYLHRRGITHNDICCDNVAVLIGSDGKAQAKFIDLGAATFNISVGISRENPSTRIPTESIRRSAPGDASKRVWPHRANYGVGHVETMSPECYMSRENPHDLRTWYDLYSSDIWSLAVVCFETLVGAQVMHYKHVLRRPRLFVAERSKSDLLDASTLGFFNTVFRYPRQRIKEEPWIRTHATFAMAETTDASTDASKDDSSSALPSASATDPRQSAEARADARSSRRRASVDLATRSSKE